MMLVTIEYWRFRNGILPWCHPERRRSRREGPDACFYGGRQPAAGTNRSAASLGHHVV